MIHGGVNNLYISYNRLNLIEKVEQNGSTLANYSYLADGTKFSATDADENGLYYLGSLVYERSSSGQSLELESLGFDGGRFIKTTSGLEPRYFITDHLGSVRVVVNGQGEVLEQNDYYPFGLRWENAESPITDNRYRYNGKEEQSFVSVPYIDYGARMYDPKYSIRWTGVDPLSEKYLNLSPYAFCAGNPIKFVDPNGEEVWIHYNNDGTEEKLLYTGGMSYEGSNSFVSHIVDNLNAVYSNGGNKLLDVLIASNNAYDMVDQTPTIESAGAVFRPYQNGGGKIFAQMLGATHGITTVEGMAHELMHGVQYEYGQGGKTIFNEVEAYVFGSGVASSYASSRGEGFGSMTGMGVSDSAAAAAWESSFNDLVDNGYSKATMHNAIYNFKEGAQENQSGEYSRYPLRNSNPTRSMLSGFWAGKIK